MGDFSSLLQQGAANVWLFVPSAILLGALHGLEPGHSKTMMAAFIVAIRGTVKQAVFLGLAATLSHTSIVWLIALGGMYVSRRFTAEATEPYFQLISGVIILGAAAWMFWRTWKGERQWKFEMEGAEHSHHAHDAHGSHHEESHLINTGHGLVEFSIFETDVPPRWRLIALDGPPWEADQISLDIVRPDGAKQIFKFEQKEGYAESIEEIPEPHEFTAHLTLGHGDHAHLYEVTLSESDHDHNHNHDHSRLEGLDRSSKKYQDDHEQAHANDIRRRFSNKNATTGQIVLFGLTGGLIPCPAAITVLLLCIQVKEFALGAVLVLCFSIGLALTLVAVGVGAAISVRQVAKRWSGLSAMARRAPYFSSALIAIVGVYMGIHGWMGLT